MNRTQLIQGYIDLTGAKSYLEIGLGDCRNFDAIRCGLKYGIDPVANMKLHEKFNLLAKASKWKRIQRKLKKQIREVLP